VDFDQRPILVFWETTRACGLACRHCRACAMPAPLTGELSRAEGEHLLDQLAAFGMPRPVLIATGGDVLMRADLDRLARRAAGLRIPLALAPSVTPLLTRERVAELRERGVKVASISLDGASSDVHDAIRGVSGHFEQTLSAIRMLREERITVQVNSLVSEATVLELPAILRLAKQAGASIWELFFLVQTGRGAGLAELSAKECEHVCHFLFDASCHGVIVRTVEAPFFRRVVALRAAGGAAPRGGLYRQLNAALNAELGSPRGQARAQTKGTRDGRGVIFVGHDGTITPSGFLPLELGNVRQDSLVDVYRKHPLLRAIRAAEFHGRCGRCPWRELCGGSRARAYSAHGDPLAEDPCCAYQPQSRSSAPHPSRHGAATPSKMQP
jgi:radical SAM protein